MVSQITLNDALSQLPKLMEADGKRKTHIVSILILNGWIYDVYEFDGKDIGFAMVHGYESELGYFSLSEISKHVIGFTVEKNEVIIEEA